MSEILVWKVQPQSKRACWTDDLDEALREIRGLLAREPDCNVLLAGVRMPRARFDALPAFTGYEKGGTA